MKKTAYILLALIATTVIGAFVADRFGLLDD